MKTLHKKTNQSAFTLAELIVAMPIMAILMVSMAAAISGAMDNYEENSQSYSLNHSARLLGERMAREIRSANNAYVSMSLLSLDMPGEPSQIQYYLMEGTLYHLQLNEGKQTISPLLGPADGLTVQAFTVDMNMRDIEGTYYATLITAKIDILVDGEIRSLTISASPRKNQEGF